MAKTKTQTKVCSTCKEPKPTTQFYKCKSTKDNLQYVCKGCSDKRVSKLLKADKSAIVYRIVNPLGEIYIGKTFKKLKYRFTDHKSRYKFQKVNGKSTFPLLHSSFDKHGIDTHIFEVVVDLGNISKEELKTAEKMHIQLIKKTGKSLNKYN